MKRRITAALLAMLMTAMVGCGAPAASSPAATPATPPTSSGADAKPADPAKPAEPVEIVLWHNRGGAAGELLEKELIEEFNKAHPSIKVTAVYQGNDSISKMKTLVQSNDLKNMPDMLQAFAGDTEYMTTVPQLVPIQELIDKDSSFVLDNIMPQLVNTYTMNGKLYGLPFHASTMIFYYNKTAFKAAGLDPEAPPKTLTELAAIAPKLLKKDGDKVTQYAITCGLQNAYYNHLIGGQGEYSFIGNNDNGRTGRMTKVEFDTNGTMKKLLTIWKQLLDTGAVQSIDEGNQARDEFGAGISAMMFTSNSSLAATKKLSVEKNFELGVAALPKVDAADKGGVAPGGSAVYVFNRNDQAKIDASWEFIKYWTSPETQAIWASKIGVVPVNKLAIDTDIMKDYLKTTPEFMVAYNAMLESHPAVQEHLAPTQQAFTTIFKERSQAFAAGKLTVDEAVKAMADECNKALDEYNRANPVT